MPTTTERIKRVPKNTANPIQALNDAGVANSQLATIWGVSSDAVRKLRRFDFAPGWSLAKRMAETFGWAAADVADFYSDRVARVDR